MTQTAKQIKDALTANIQKINSLHESNNKLHKALVDKCPYKVGTTIVCNDEVSNHNGKTMSIESISVKTISPTKWQLVVRGKVLTRSGVPGKYNAVAYLQPPTR